MKEERKKSLLRIGIDVFLYLSIFIPLLLSILGRFEFELGSFNCNDPSIRLQYRGNTLSRKVVVFIIFIPIIFFVFITELLRGARSSWKEQAKEAAVVTASIYVRYLVYSTLNILINDILKVLSSVPRPHFIETCEPDWSQINCTANGGVVPFRRSLCLNPATSEVLDSTKSWPSGHAQLITFSIVYIMVYIERRVGTELSWLLKRWIQVLLFIVPVFAATSRIQDQRHHTWDVVVGAGLGLLLALLTTINSFNIDTPHTTQEKEDGPEEKQKKHSRMHLLKEEFSSV